jgi:hypothetical protein
MMKTTRATKSGRRLRGLVTVAATALALVAASPAQAAGGANASDDQYAGVLGQQSGGGGEGGTLPFTGADLVLILGVGTGLTAAGAAVRRAARPDA